jgi:hypothetical protein
MADDADNAASLAERLAAARDRQPARPIHFVCFKTAAVRERKTVLASHVEKWIALGWVVVGPQGAKVTIEWPGEGEGPTPARPER